MSLTFTEMMGKIPPTLFEEVSGEFPVDRCNHKLTGQTIFSLLLYNLCEEDRISLRVIEDSFSHHGLKILHKGKPIKASRSGLSDRLKTIDFRYFEEIFLKLRDIFIQEFPRKEAYSLVLFDSTLVTLSSALLKTGFRVANGSQNQIKFSVGFDGLPQSVRFGTTSSDYSEDVSLKEAIQKVSLSKEKIVVFDRGLSARKTFEHFSQNGIQFVTRLNDKAHYKIIQNTPVTSLPADSSLHIEADSTVWLRSKDVQWIKQDFRLLKAAHKETGKVFFFLTNITHLSAQDITDIYKKRWDIEVFFKFIKQHLNAKHFLSRNINGIKVVFFMILITAMMILTFKQKNEINSFKRAKKLFTEQLKRALTFQIILIYKDDPNIFQQNFIH